MSTPRTYFVTGTDTGVGKTLVSAALLLDAAKRGRRTLGIKPVAAGCELREGHLVNADALALQAASTVPVAYTQVNPVAFAAPIAPHVAAAATGVRMRAAGLAGHVESLAPLGADFTVVEGAGGWLVPVNESETLADVCVRLGADVVMVVGMKLGCLNHALLTRDAIAASGASLAAWVANRIDPQMAVADENLDALRERLDAPCLGSIPTLSDARASTAADHLDGSLLP